MKTFHQYLEEALQSIPIHSVHPSALVGGPKEPTTPTEDKKNPPLDLDMLKQPRKEESK